MRRLWPLLLLLLLLLPGLPPLLGYGVLRALPALGLSGRVGRVSGYALFGLTLADVDLKGRGFRLKAKRVRLDYQLLGLLAGKLPVAVALNDAELELDWATLLEGGPAGGAGPAPVLTGLGLENVRLRLGEDRGLMLPALALEVAGRGPYRILGRLAGVPVSGRFFLRPRPELEFSIPVAALRYWYPGAEGGTLAGRLWSEKGRLRGRAALEDGAFRVVGFSLTAVRGTLSLEGDRVRAELRGRGLEGPVSGRVSLDLAKPGYRFTVEAEPRWRALARHFGVELPLAGSGRLELAGSGWEDLKLSGRFSGRPALLGYPLETEGTLAYDGTFRLEARSRGRFYDRAVALGFALEGERWALKLTDEKGSRLAVSGRGDRGEGGGRLVLPSPLVGEAVLEAGIEGASWRVRVRSEGVRLPLAKPFSLSGELAGTGDRVAGRLGPLDLGGRWSDLALTLRPLPLAVGEVAGRGGYRAGKLFATLRYRSPYAAFPVEVRQDGAAFRFQSPYGEGAYQNGRFSLAVRGLPLSLGEPLWLSGTAAWEGAGWRGRFELSGAHLRAEGRLSGREAAFSGALFGPYGPLSFRGRAGPDGVRVAGDGFRLTLAGGRAAFLGAVRYGPLALEGALSRSGKGYRGRVRVETPWVRGLVYGEGMRLLARLHGVADLAGELWPNLRLAGATRPLRLGPIEVPALPLRLTKDRVALGAGWVDLDARRLSLSVPFRYAGREGRLSVAGDFARGRARLEAPDLEASAEGPWGALTLVGVSPTTGFRLRGTLDATRLDYRLRLVHPGVEGALVVRGRGANAGYAGRLRAGGTLELSGENAAFRLVAKGFSLAPFGLPGEVSGRLAYAGGLSGDLKLETPYGALSAAGQGTLSLRVEGPFFEGEGAASPGGLTLDLRSRHPWVAGRVRLGLDAKGVWAGGSGVYRVPYLAREGWRFSLAGSRWRLRGPLEVSGEGLAFDGRVNWKTALGPLSGTLAGQGADVRAKLRLGLPEGAAEVALATRPLAVTARLPGGTVRYRGGRLEVPGLDLGRLAGAWGLPLSGLVRGGLGGGALLSGWLAGGGAELRFALREGGGLLWSPTLKAGVRVRFGGGVRVRGLGRLHGDAAVAPGAVSGRLVYDGPVRLRLGLSGTPAAPRLAVSGEGPGVSLDGRLTGPSYRVRLRYRTPLAEGSLELRGRGLRYRGVGELRTKRGLLQAGPLRLSGEGARVEARWEAPLAFRYQDGALSVRGAAPLEAGHLVSGALRYDGAGFSGELKVEGPWLNGRLRGRGALALRLATPWGRGEAEVSPDGRLSGLVSLSLGPLSARAWLGGRLAEPVLAGEGALSGRGARLGFAFGYDHGPWLRGEGEGARVRLSGNFLEARFRRFDLAPYLGVPLVLDLEGAEALPRFRAPFRLQGPGVGLEGVLDLGARRLTARGRVEGGAVSIAASPEEARISIDHPSVKGSLGWSPKEGPTGALRLRLPLPGGELRGRFTAEDARLHLVGGGALSGALDYYPLRAVASGALAYQVDGVGSVGLLGQGRAIALLGEGGLAPLAGRLDLARGRFSWRYRGPLPEGLGWLEAGGRFPGRWLTGEAEVLGRRFRLSGAGAAMTLSGPGLFFHLGRGGPKLVLEGFRLGPLRLWGRAEGNFRDLSGALRWRLGDLEGRLSLAWDGALSIGAEGDVSGSLRVGREGWRGRLAFPGGALRFGPGFRARGTLFAQPVSLDLAGRTLALGGLSVRFPWAFSGHTEVFGVELRGQGRTLFARYRGVRARLTPSPLSLRLTLAGAEGALSYRDGRLSGAISGRLGPLAWRAVADGRAVRLLAEHPEFPGVPYPAGRVLASLDLSGAWSLAYRAGPFLAEGEGQGLAGAVELKSPYGGGRLRLGAGGVEGRVRVRDLPFFGFGLDLDLKGTALAFTLKGAAGELRGTGALRGYALASLQAAGFNLDAARLPAVAERLPYLEGHLSAVARYRDGEAFVQVGSADLGVRGRRFPLALSLRYRKKLSGELRYAGLRLRFSRDGGFRADGELRAFPLDLPVAMLAGPLPGEVRLSGRFAGGYDPARPEAAWFELSGERLLARAEGEELLGRVALAYKRRTLELRTLDLAGTGRWRGGGRWKLGQGGDLWLRAERTDFTPLLRLWPPLARWRPQARGSLFLEAQGSTLTAQGSAAFALAGVSGRFWGLNLVYRSDGELRLSLDGQVERPVQSRVHLAGEGRVPALVFRAEGDFAAPLIGRVAPVRARLRYPSLALSAEGPGFRLEGRLRPLALVLKGTVPLTYPRYYLESGEARLDLALAEDQGRYRLSGEIAVLRALLAVPKKRPVIETKKARPLPLVFDRVRIHAEGGVVVNEPLAQGELSGAVILAGSAADPYLTGEVRALRGSFLLLNHRFRVIEGAARFFPEGGVYPELFLKARAETPRGPLFLLAEGRFVKRAGRAELALDTCLATAPAETLAACKLLPQEEAAAALLGLGRGDLAEEAVGAAVQNLLIGQIEAELARSLGLDLFQIETRAFQGEGLETTRFTLGKYLSPRFFVAYNLDFEKGSRVYASYQSDGLKLTFATDLSPEPSPEFSLRYAFSESFAVFGQVARDAFQLGLEWRP